MLKQPYNNRFKKITYFLIGLDSVRINNEVGPPPAGGLPLLLGPPILSADQWAPLQPEYPPPTSLCPDSAASCAAAANLLNKLI